MNRLLHCIAWAGLSALFVACLAWIGYALLIPIRVDPPRIVPQAEPATAAAAGSPVASPGPGAWAPARQALIARPLFEPERRPFVAPPPPPPVPAAAPRPAPPPPPPPAARTLAEQGWQLAGTLVDGAARVAFFRVPGAAATRKLGEGESVQGWRIDRIEAGRVLLSQGGREDILTWPKQAPRAGPPGMRPPPLPPPRR